METDEITDIDFKRNPLGAGGGPYKLVLFYKIFTLSESSIKYRNVA